MNTLPNPMESSQLRPASLADRPVEGVNHLIWSYGPRLYFAAMACVLVAAATAKGLSIRVQPAGSGAPDPVLTFLSSGMVQSAAIFLEVTVAIVLVASRDLRRKALTLLGLGLAFLSYRSGMAFAGSASCSCLGHSSITGIAAEDASRLATWIVGGAIAGSSAVLAFLARAANDTAVTEGSSHDHA